MSFIVVHTRGGIDNFEVHKGHLHSNENKKIRNVHVFL